MLRIFCRMKTRVTLDSDATEDHDDQADEAEIILRPIEALTNLIVHVAVGPRVDEILLEVGAKRPDELQYRPLRHFDQNLPAPLGCQT